MRSYLLAFILVVPAYAQTQCDQVQSSLTSLEQSLLSKQLPACDQVTPASVGMTEALEGDDLRLFNAMRCQNVAGLDLALSDVESTLVIVDGLNDLRTQVVATQQSLASQPNWDRAENESALQFARDLTLGATIQNLIELPQLPALFDDATNSGQWEAKLRTFCSAAPQNASPFCAMITTYMTGNNAALVMSEFATFLDQLRPALQADKTLSPEQKTPMIAALTLRNGEQAVSFSDYQEQAAENDIYNFTNPSAPGYLNAQQARFVRQNRLSVPPTAASVELLQTLLGRMDRNQNQLILKNSMNALKRNADDAHERTLARVRARWTSLHLHKGGSAPIPCVQSTTEATLKSCIQTEWRARPSNNNGQVQLYASILASLDSVQQKRADVTNCIARPSVTAWLQNPQATPESCMSELIGQRSNIEKKREIIHKIRERLRAQEDRNLRFRRFAYDKALECSRSNDRFASRTHESIPYCSTSPSEISFGTILQLTNESLNFVHEGLDSDTVFDRNRDCPPGQQDEYAVLCEIAHGRGAGAGDGATATQYQGSPQTPGTDAPTRTSDPILRDALTGVANDLANQYIQNRLQATQPQIYRWPQSPYQPMPYSQPLSLSMSDYVIARGVTFGGFGQYYQCTTCGYGSGPAAFNQRWGLSGANVGASTLGSMGGSRFFGGAGTFQF